MNLERRFVSPAALVAAATLLPIAIPLVGCTNQPDQTPPAQYAGQPGAAQPYPQQQYPQQPYPQQQQPYPQQQQPQQQPYPQQPGYPPPAPQPQGQPGIVPPAPAPQPQSYPTAQTQPTAPPPASPFPTALPFPAPGFPPATPAASGPAATPIDPNFAAVATGPLFIFAASEAPGMSKEGPLVAAQFQQGQVLETPLTLQPNKCYAVLAVGVGIQEVDITLQLTTPIPNMNPTLAHDTGTGSQGSLGGKGNCYKWQVPVAAQAKFVITATRGAGMAAGQAYSK